MNIGSTGGGLFAGREEHPERATILQEVHARPFHPLETPARLLHFAFLTTAAEAQAGRAALETFCERRGLPSPAAHARHHRLRLGGESLRWEQHGEFTTYTVQVDAPGATPFQPPAGVLPSAFAGFEQPGQHIVSVDLHLLPSDHEPALADIFDPASLAGSIVNGGRALVATDFRPRGDVVPILVVDRGLDPAAAGALAVRLLEIETYRVLALLGLPESQRAAPLVAEAEAELARISGAMTATEGLEDDNRLLERLTVLAARSEAEASQSAFRFGASRAYDNIVEQRLVAIAEEPAGAMPTLAAFLSRRMKPAMRTCRTLQERQVDLSRKLSRSANLLRTRVDVEIERQNRDLLRSMNERTRLQLRLQQTVEGLSVAAISYYVVGLAGYVFKAAHETGFLPVDPVVATAGFVPVAILVIAFLLRRIRREHAD